MATDAEHVDPRGEWEIIGQLADASNATLLVRSGDEQFVYKPVRGERPLWDFPTGTLGRREVAAFRVSQSLGWNLIPRTRWVRDAPFGPGSVQDWVASDGFPVQVFPMGEVPDGWLAVISGIDDQDRGIEVAHRDSDDLRRMAVFDLLVNNADRKGGHIMMCPEPGPGVPASNPVIRGIDHGLCFHQEPKLRTVLWGFVGTPIPAPLLADIERCLPELPDLLQGLSTEERGALRARGKSLLAAGEFPPPAGGPVIPWPPI